MSGHKFLIIDEPELNLHPQNQRKVARLLARIVRAGIKVMISTHSDHIVRELNNLIMLSADKDGALRKKHGYDEEETLSPGAGRRIPLRRRPRSPHPLAPTAFCRVPLSRATSVDDVALERGGSH